MTFLGDSSSCGHFPRIFKWYFYHRSGTSGPVYFDRSVTTIEEIVSALRFFFNQGSSSSFTDSVLQLSEQAFLGSSILNPTKQFPTESKICDYKNKKQEILFCLKFHTSIGQNTRGVAESGSYLAPPVSS